MSYAIKQRKHALILIYELFLISLLTNRRSNRVCEDFKTLNLFILSRDHVLAKPGKVT